MKLDDFTEKLHRVSSKSLDVLERRIDGDETVQQEQAASASTVLSARFKQDSTINGRARNLISLIKLGVRDPDAREVVARQVMTDLGVAVPQLASGDVVPDNA
jgi:hypothetical protein